MIQHFGGWRGEDEIDAGFRDGPFVDFGSTGDTSIDSPSTGITDWRFGIVSTAATVTVRYSLGPQSSRHGTLTLPRTR